MHFRADNQIWPKKLKTTKLRATPIDTPTRSEAAIRSSYFCSETCTPSQCQKQGAQQAVAAAKGAIEASILDQTNGESYYAG